MRKLIVLAFVFLPMGIFASPFLCVAQCSQETGNPQSEGMGSHVVTTQIMAAGPDANTAFTAMKAKCSFTLNIGSDTVADYQYNNDSTSDEYYYLENGVWLEATFTAATAANACIDLGM